MQPTKTAGVVGHSACRGEEEEEEEELKDKEEEEKEEKEKEEEEEKEETHNLDSREPVVQDGVERGVVGDGEAEKEDVSGEKRGGGDQVLH